MNRICIRFGWLCCLLQCLTFPALLIGQSPAPRTGHVMTSAGAAGGVLVIAGLIDTIPRTADSLWLWKSGKWRMLSDAGPGNRVLPAAAFDFQRKVLVLYGGVGLASGTRYGDTWEWDGLRWRERNVVTPGPRDHHVMVFAEAQGVSLMYGGGIPGNERFPNDTWTWDGNLWTRADTATGPGGLVHHAMAYDTRRKKAVLYGGINNDRQPSGETWEWDGLRWSRVGVTGPSPGPRARHRMAYDARRGETILFGGGEAGDTWAWDGATWKRRALSGPPSREMHAMAYDSARQRIVLFAGSDGNGDPPQGFNNETWEWDGGGWSRSQEPR